jgi:hypothetical protein
MLIGMEGGGRDRSLRFSENLKIYISVEKWLRAISYSSLKSEAIGYIIICLERELVDLSNVVD